MVDDPVVTVYVYGNTDIEAGDATVLGVVDPCTKAFATELAPVDSP
jgi:hypothetical protein